MAAPRPSSVSPRPRVAAPGTATPAARPPLLVAMLLALVLAGGFCYPSGAYPGTSLLLALVLAALVALPLASLLLRSAVSHHGRSGLRPDSELLAALFPLPVLAGLLLALWAALRWRWLPITHAGRPGVIDMQWFALALVAGCALPPLLQRIGAGPQLCVLTLRRILVLALLGFVVYAFYQYFVSYPARLRELSAQQQGPVQDLMTQSLLHAFAERRVSGMLGNPNLFAAQLALLALCAVAGFGRREAHAWRALNVFAWCAAAACLALTASRGGVLTFAAATAGGLLLLTFTGQWRVPRSASLALLLLCAVFCCAQFNIAAASLAERLTRSDTIRERLNYWHIALQLWRGHPLVGAGPGGFVLAYPLLKPELARESQYAHSWFFQYAAELGGIGLALAGLYWGALLRSMTSLARRLRHEPAQPMPREAMWCFALALLPGFNGLFEFTLQWREFLIWSGLWAGLGCGLAGLLAPAVPPAARAAGLRGALGLPAAAAVLILALLLTPPYHRARTAQWLGDDLASQGDAAGAAAAFARAAALQPDDPQFELSQAQALARLGDPAALPHVRRAIAIDPRSAAARAELARWCAQHGDPAGALGNLDEALRLYPSHVGYRLERAELHLRQGNRAAARADVDYILGHKLLVWEFEQPRLDQLKATLGLS